jgi:hypothetical protein
MFMNWSGLIIEIKLEGFVLKLNNISWLLF